MFVARVKVFTITFVTAVVCLSLYSPLHAIEITWDAVNPIVENCTVNSSALYNYESDEYKYTYIISNSFPNTGAIDIIILDISAKKYEASKAPEGISHDYYVSRPSAPPILSISRVTSPEGWKVDRGARALLVWDVATLGFDPKTRDPYGGSPLLPGSSFTFSLVSRNPPGIRVMDLEPEWDSTDPRTRVGNDRQIEQIKKVVGPVDASTYKVGIRNAFPGNSKSSAEVQRFLSYLDPISSEAEIVSANDSAAIKIVVVYGPTIIPATFVATIDSENIEKYFHPCACCVEPVEFNIKRKNSTNYVRLSIEGTTKAGLVARDTDNLVFRIK